MPDETPQEETVTMTIPNDPQEPQIIIAPVESTLISGMAMGTAGNQGTALITAALGTPAQGTTQNEGVATPQPDLTNQPSIPTITVPLPPLEPPKKHAGGRPCEYCKNKEIIQAKADAFLAKHKPTEAGKVTIPWVEELAIELDTIDDTVVNWANKITPTGEREHPEFFATYAKVKQIQKLRLQQRALGRYNPMGALKLLQFNHGAIETSKQIIGGAANEPVQVEIIEERSKPE
jgi:hypothetical protein